MEETILSDNEVREGDTDEEKHLAKKCIGSYSVDNEVIKVKKDEGLLKMVDLEHIMTTHKKEFQVIECSLCDQKVPKKNALKIHIKKIHISLVTECSLCDQKFTTNTALKSHIKKIHLSGETSTCSICNKEYKDLFNHIKFVHDRIRNYECSYCKKKFQAKKLLYNHVQSVHLGEKTNCLDCKRDVSVDNFRRHVKEFHEGTKKPCPQCKKEFGMANLRRHIRQVHNNESTKCPKCGKSLTISNMNKHIQSVHNKLKRVCGLCNKEVPFSSISDHKRRVHKIEKSVDDVKPRGPNLKLRESTQGKFDKIREDDFNIQWNKGWVKEEGHYYIDNKVLEDLDHEVTEDGSNTGRVGEKNFTWVEMMSEPFTETVLLD